MRKAVYAGTLDPYTKGHEYVVEFISPLVDELVVAIGINHDKKTMFSLEQRLDMVKAATRKYHNVTVASFEHYFLVDYASSIGADLIIRGIRNPQDFIYEQSMKQVNKLIDPSVKTIFVIPDREFVDISSSMVKGLIGPDGWKEIVRNYIPVDMQEMFFRYTK